MVSTSAAFRALNPSRDQLAKLCGKDVQLQRQIERLFDLTSKTVMGATVMESTPLDADGVTLSVELDIGRYFVDFFAYFVTVGGGAGNGWAVDQVGTADLAAGFLSVIYGSTTATTIAALPLPIATSDNVADSMLTLRGFLDVRQRGSFGLKLRRAGAPVSTTLQAGAGLTASIVKEFST